MMRSLWTAASGMRAQQINVDTIANNVSNVNTIGYKSQQASFKSLLYQNLQAVSTNNAGDRKPVAAEVGLGSRVSAITSTFEQGDLVANDNPYWVALDGEGFFQVRDAQGDLYYTRDGSFNVSPSANGNLLCTADGYAVLDAYGRNIYLPRDFSADDLVISDSGQFMYPDETGNAVPYVVDGLPVQFGLYQFNNPAGLSKSGNNNFSITAASGQPMLEGQNPNLSVTKTHQKYTEGSNVDVANEMVNLIVAQRAYEMNSKAIQATDDMMQQANNLR